MILLLFPVTWLIAEEEKPDESARLAELDAYWAEVARAVHEGDFAAYQATCHPEAVLVSGKAQTSYPLSKALARWKSEFDATKAGKIESRPGAALFPTTWRRNHRA